MDHILHYPNLSNGKNAIFSENVSALAYRSVNWISAKKPD